MRKIYVVEKETDETPGLLVVLSRERLLVYWTSSGLVMLPQSVVSNRWRIFGCKFESLSKRDEKKLSGLLKVLKTEHFWEELKQEKGTIKELLKERLEMFRMSALGRLLEDLMFTSKNLRDCLSSFGRDFGSSGIMQFVLLQIPLVGGTIYTALEFYGMGKIVGSNYINPDEKFETVFKTVTKVTATIGTAVGGGVIGQILIPIPVFGAMIGGIVGGAVGTVFGKAIQSIKTHVPLQFTALVARLRESRSDTGDWGFEGLGGQCKDVMAR